MLAHSDVAPSRKQDPGEKFPWRRLHAAGVGHWVEPAPLTEGRDPGIRSRAAAVRDLQRALAATATASQPRRFDELTKDVVMAFQRHFRPARVDGIADVSTRKTLSALIAARDGRLA